MIVFFNQVSQINAADIPFFSRYVSKMSFLLIRLLILICTIFRLVINNFGTSYSVKFVVNFRPKLLFLGVPLLHPLNQEGEEILHVLRFFLQLANCVEFLPKCSAITSIFVVSDSDFLGFPGKQDRYLEQSRPRTPWGVVVSQELQVKVDVSCDLDFNKCRTSSASTHYSFRVLYTSAVTMENISSGNCKIVIL